MEIAHLKVGNGFRSFLGDLKKFCGLPETTVEKAVALLKNVDSGIKTTDEVLKRLKVTKDARGALLLNDVHVGHVNRLLREGDLKKLSSVCKLNVPLTAADEAAFRRLVGHTPESGLKIVDDLATATKRERPYMHATAKNLDKISETARRDLKKVESNLYRHFKEGAVIALTIGTVIVGTDWIAKATAARTGCFMVTTINGKTTSCKVTSCTCTNNVVDNNACSGTLDYYNITLVIMNLASSADSDPNKIALAAAVGVVPSRMNAELVNIMDNHYPAAAAAVGKMDSRTFRAFSVCGVKNNAVENGVVPPCRMCDPTADPVSTAFIDPTQYGDNVTFQCVTNPSVLDTISDTVVSTGKDLWVGVSDVFSWSLKQIGIVAAVIVILVVLASLVARIITRKRSERDSLDSGSLQSSLPFLVSD